MSKTLNVLWIITALVAEAYLLHHLNVTFGSWSEWYGYVEATFYRSPMWLNVTCMISTLLLCPISAASSAIMLHE